MCHYDDPELEMFKEHNRGIIDLRILENGVGCEKFAIELVLSIYKTLYKEKQMEKVSVSKVQCWEHEDNIMNII